jgi:hypothetical protein
VSRQSGASTGRKVTWIEWAVRAGWNGPARERICWARGRRAGAGSGRPWRVAVGAGEWWRIVPPEVFSIEFISFWRSRWVSIVSGYAALRWATVSPC